MPADDLQGVLQRRVLDPGIPADGQVINVEEPLPGRLFRRAPAGCPLAFEVCIVDHGQTAVQSFQVESHRVKGCERRQQQPLLRQCFG